MTSDEFKVAAVGMLVDVVFVARMVPAMTPEDTNRGPLPEGVESARYVVKQRRILATNALHRRKGDAPTIRVLDFYLREAVEVPADIVDIPGDEK